MYMFLQYLLYFTPQVLKTFYEDDSQLKERELSNVSGREALKSASGIYSPLSMTGNRLLEIQLKDLPFQELMKNFKETFSKIFIQEKPDPIERYYLSSICIIQITTTKVYDTLMNFCFTNDTTKQVDFSSSPETKKLVKKILKHISRLENFQSDSKNNEAGATVKIQMYEFFFSHILIKAMQVPFLEHAFMLGFFERNIRKRVTEENVSKSKKKVYRRREFEHERRDRTIKLRQFYEFFSLCFDQTMFTPFSQFLSDKALKDLNGALKNRIKKKGILEARDESIGKIKFNFLEDLKHAGRARSTAQNNITPLGYASKPNQYILTRDGRDMTVEDQDSSAIDERKETSRFGEMNHFKTLNEKDKIKKDFKLEKIKPVKPGAINDFSDFTDENIKNVIEGDIPDETLSLSNITKERAKDASVVKNSKMSRQKYEIIGKIKARYREEFSQLSKIDKGNNSGLSHSYDYYAYANMTPLSCLKENSSYYNKYALKQIISKSDLSASFPIQYANNSSNEHTPERYAHPKMTPPPTFGANDFKLINNEVDVDDLKPYRNKRNHNESKNRSNLSEARSSISRIFQRSPDRISDLN